MKNPTIEEVLAEMKGQPLVEVTNHLAKLMDDAGVDVPMERMLQAVATSTLDTIGALARDVGVLLKGAGADIDPDTYAGTHFGIALLKAQVQVYTEFMPDQEEYGDMTPAEIEAVVEGEIVG